MLSLIIIQTYHLHHIIQRVWNMFALFNFLIFFFTCCSQFLHSVISRMAFIFSALSSQSLSQSSIKNLLMNLMYVIYKKPFVLRNSLDKYFLSPILTEMHHTVPAFEKIAYYIEQ